MENQWISEQEKQESPEFVLITQNEFLGRKQRKLVDEDIAVCECIYNVNNPEGACGENCLNVLTNTECTPGYCRCGEHCRNQRFQKCEYANTKLFKTEGRGWGLLADENIMAGQFIIEYCGEVIPSDEAESRSHKYEDQGLKDSYTISLDANFFIDATRKGSLARFINHSCDPNCETRKWTVLGETRVGIFAKKDIACGTELSYDYNFEWYGGATVRCLCGAANCSLFLGAKSHGFQEYNHLWEDGDARYTVENIPLYDSAEDDPFPQPAHTTVVKSETVKNFSVDVENTIGPGIKSESSEYSYVLPESEVKPLVETSEDKERSLEEKKAVFSHTNAMISRIRSNTAARNYNIAPGPLSKKRPQNGGKQKSKTSSKKYVSSKPVPQLFASRKAQEEIRRYEELKDAATSELNSLYDEIRPVIEEHERDNQDNISTSVAEKWMQATCAKWKAEFDFHFSIVKNVICPQNPNTEEAKPAEGGELIEN